MHVFVKKTMAVAVTAAMFTTSLVPAMAATPAVQGPESVQDWYNAGQQFIRNAERMRPNLRHAKNIILFVGDGMGVSTVTAARILAGQQNGRPGEENRLSFEYFPYTAYSKTYSWDQQTSDSAPTMTAIMTGYKAREGMLAVDHLTSRNECDPAVIAAHALPTLLEQAAAEGKMTGVVTTARLTHATPAATYAHTAVRDWEADSNKPAGCGVKDIAQQLIEASPEVKASLHVAMGGGRTYFMPKTQLDPEYNKKGLRNDGRDLTAEWLSSRGADAKYVWDRAGFDAATPSNTSYLLGLFENSHMQYEADRARDKAGEPSLTEMTEKAISMLQNGDKGYFLHVEGGRIDHAHHAGNAKRALIDAIELSKAVQKAYDMTDPRDTLIIVTADHSHTFTIAGYPHRGNDIVGLVSGVPAIDGSPAMLDMDKLGLPYTTLGYANGPGWRDAIVNGAKRPDLTSVDTTSLNFLQESTVPLDSETHAGEDVGVYATGPMAHLVHGSMEQNWIYHVMRASFGFDDERQPR
ncbi:MAG: alkaline phosphatase [Pseudomonadota bacterium]